MNHITFESNPNESQSILSFELKQNRLEGLICYIIFYISRNLHTIFDTKNNLAIIYKGRHRENELIKDYFLIRTESKPCENHTFS